MMPPSDAPSDAEPVGTGERVDVVLDANVLLEIVTIADLNRSSLDCELLPQGAAANNLETRRRRARSSLAVAWLLHCRRWTSLVLRHEAIRKTIGLAPPETPDGAHAWFFTWFLKDYVLGGWNDNYTQELAFDDTGQYGNTCDRTLVRLAHEKGVPLVSNEQKAKGAVAKEANRRGVRVLTPAAYLHAQGAAEDALAHEFLNAAGLKLIEFLADRNEAWVTTPADLENAIGFYAVLRFILT